MHASVSRVELSPDALTLGVGMSQKVEAHVYYANGAYLTPNDVDMAGVGEFASSDPSIAEVDEYGNVTGVSKGTATITFKRFDNGTIGEASVAVVGEPTAIYIDRSDISLGVGMETVLNVTFNPNEYGEVRFSSNATDVATVDQEGKITAVGMGVALITVETYNGCYTYCTVRVTNAPDAVTLDITSSNLSIGGTVKLTPTATFEGGSDCAATFTFAEQRAVHRDGGFGGQRPRREHRQCRHSRVHAERPACGLQCDRPSGGDQRGSVGVGGDHWRRTVGDHRCADQLSRRFLHLHRERLELRQL